MKIDTNIESTVIFDNGGGVTLQLPGYSHHYASGELAAVDYAAYLRDTDTTGWDGGDDDGSENLDPTDAEIRNGGYRVWNTSDFADAYGDTDFESEESWNNVIDFVYHTSENVRPK